MTFDILIGSQSVNTLFESGTSEEKKKTDGFGWRRKGVMVQCLYTVLKTQVWEEIMGP